MGSRSGQGGEPGPLATETLQMVELVAGGIAHDFNNLLQTMQARVELVVRAGGLSESQLRHLEGALECAREAQALTSQLKLLARGGAPQRTRADLRTLSEQALARCLAESPTIVQVLSVATDAQTALVDKAQLGQVLDNLLHNARQAMLDGGHVWVDIDRTEIDGHNGLSAGEYIRIRVRDDGPGIPAAHLDRIFEPDFTTKPDGTGIGLATCRGIARRHGGQLTCSSEPGTGTTFTLLLPPDGTDSSPPGSR